MELYVKPVQTYMKSVSAVLALPDGEVIISHHEYYSKYEQHVVRLDHTGKTLCKLYISDVWINGFILQDDQVVILHRDGTLTWIRITDGRKMDQYKVNVRCLYHGKTLDNDTLLLVDNGDRGSSNGRVFTFSKSSRMTNDMVINLKRPVSVSKTIINAKVLYLVCTDAVSIYSDDWKLQRTVKGVGQGVQVRINPWSAVVLSKNTMLVSDCENHCIMELSLEGQLLEQKAKMEYPSDISLYHPYVWIMHGIRPSNVICYKIYN